MFILFTFILLFGFAVLYLAGKDISEANPASVFENILSYFGKE
jgi:hypothetical protein